MEISYFAIIIGAIFVNNVVLAQFLGICPFLGVSSKVETSLGMGAAVTFVMALTAVVAWPIQTYILVPLGIEYMQTIVFILVIAALVQMVEIILKKMSPSLYQALGIFLPLITTNCAVLGVAILMIQKEFTLLQSVTYPSRRPWDSAWRWCSSRVSANGSSSRTCPRRSAAFPSRSSRPASSPWPSWASRGWCSSGTLRKKRPELFERAPGVCMPGGRIGASGCRETAAVRLPSVVRSVGEPVDGEAGEADLEARIPVADLGEQADSAVGEPCERGSLRDLPRRFCGRAMSGPRRSSGRRRRCGARPCRPESNAAGGRGRPLRCGASSAVGRRCRPDRAGRTTCRRGSMSRPGRAKRRSGGNPCRGCGCS